MKLSVTCNSGHKGEKTPCAFHLGGRRLHVIAVLDSWGDAPHRYFEVAVEDRRRFVLHHDMSLSCWELAGVFAAAKPRPRPLPSQQGARGATSAWWRFGRS